MNIELEMKWIYLQHKKFRDPDCWNVRIENHPELIYLYYTNPPRDEEYPVYQYINKSAKNIDDIKEFVIFESSSRCVWFTRNNSEQYSKVCHLGEGKKIEVDENRLIEIRSEIMGIINHIHQHDFGMAMVRAEIIRDILNKLI